MSHRTRRTVRVDELLKQEIARVLRDLKDPRIGFATVMDVRTSPDLRHARVYVSILGEEEEKQAALTALAHARGYVRRRVGEEITLKFLPELHFELDRTLERAARIEEILGDLDLPDESPDAPDDESPDDDAAEPSDEARDG